LNKREDYTGSKRIKVGVMTSEEVHWQQPLIVERV